MKRIDLDIQVVYSTLSEQTHGERTVTAYTDWRYPGLAVHKAWSLGSDAWEVTHIQSGLRIASLPSKAAAIRVLPLLSKFLDWSQRATDIVPAEPGEYRWLKTAIESIVKVARKPRGKQP